MRKVLRSRGVAVLACLVTALSLPLSGGSSEVRSGDRFCYALTGARVLAAPGKVIDPGVVVIRGGVFEAVGAQGQVLIPADARVFDQKGKVLHAAFIDPYVPADRLAGPGKNATLIVTDGDILDLRTRVLAAWLDGRPLDLTDKQKRLYERYRHRPGPRSR